MSGGFVTNTRMTDTNPSLESLESLDSSDLLSATRELVRKSHGVEADLLAHLGEIDDRKLYLDCAHPSMFAFCLDELGFSECAAYNRITVARIGRRLPAVIEAVRSGRVHLAGLRLLAPHLTQENHEQLLAKAAGRTKDEIAELVAAIAPRPPPPPMIRRLPEPQSLALVPKAAALPHPIVPVAEASYKVQFSISREFRDEIREAQDLLRHRMPDGDLATIFRAALEVLVAKVRKER